jgi:uncharacterized protein (TIGR03067 family)
VNRCVTTVLVAWLLAGAAPTLKGDDAVKEEAAKKDIDKLQGTWKLVSQENEGKVVEGVNEVLMIFDKDTYSYKFGGDNVGLTATFKLDPSKKPKAIDITTTENKLIPESKGRTTQAIYDLDRDAFRLAEPWSAFTARPKEFTTKKGSRFTVGTYKRVKP